MRNSSWTRALQILGVIIILTIAWLQLALHSLPSELSNSELIDADGAIYSPTSKFLDPNNPHHMSNVKKVLTVEDILEIQEQISFKSQNEILLNEEIYGPVLKETIVIVVQVHNRLDYLRNLIMSMSQAKYIDSILLIFSHDYYDDEINDLVTSIDFCKVLQIFYPHSLQTHPHSFPGESMDDCPRDTNTKQKKLAKCRGNADLYGHYREARYTQTKHHWWWKANKIFNDLWALKNHSGLVLFLEEDHYMSEDFLHMLMLYSSAMPRACPKCSVITLGNYLKNYNFANDAKRVEITQWVSSKHNMGFAFNHSVWNLIKRCRDAFCNHDDYNWDWSLQYVSRKCLTAKIFTLVARGPRVFHIGECGVHHKKKDCTSRLILNKVQRTLHSAKKFMFPEQLIVVRAPLKRSKDHKGNGGWGDERDHALCSSFVEDSSPQSSSANALIPDPIEALETWNRNETLKLKGELGPMKPVANKLR